MQVTTFRSLLTCCCLTLLLNHSGADGFLLSKKGQYIPEREQAAFIEWHGGVETLFVAVRADKAESGSLWIVPVPADPKEVQAEPTVEFPHVVRFQNRLRRIPGDLKATGQFAFAASSGLVILRMFDGSIGATTFYDVGNVLGGLDSGVTVHQHTQSHGMVVEVLTATSPGALNGYLSTKGVTTTAEQLQGLSSYIGKSFTLICAWRAEERSEARALRIRFPSPRVFYPMLPTRVYGHQVATSVFVRGWVKPDPNQVGQGVLECRCGLGEVVNRSIAEESLRGADLSLAFQREALPGVGLTRIRVAEDPRQWQRDLELDPPAFWPGWVTNLLNAKEGSHAYSLVVAFAVLAGIGFMAWFKPAAQRRWSDWLVAVLLGLSLLLTVYVLVAVAYVLLVPNKPGTNLRVSFLVFLTLWVGIFVGSGMNATGVGQIPPTDAEIMATSHALRGTLGDSGQINIPSRLTELGWVIASVSALLLLGVTALCLSLLGRRAAIGILGMAAFHALACYGVLIGLGTWIGAYVTG